MANRSAALAGNKNAAGPHKKSKAAPKKYLEGQKIFKNNMEIARANNFKKPFDAAAAKANMILGDVPQRISAESRLKAENAKLSKTIRSRAKKLKKG
jgi:hypothetical protein